MILLASHKWATDSKFSPKFRPNKSDIIDQTKQATQQSKNKWVTDSLSLHIKQVGSLTSRLLARLSLVKTLLLETSHRKNCTLGRTFNFQIELTYIGVGISYTLAWSLTGLQASVAPNDANAEVTGLCHTDGAWMVETRCWKLWTGICPKHSAPGRSWHSESSGAASLRSTNLFCRGSPWAPLRIFSKEGHLMGGFPTSGSTTGRWQSLEEHSGLVFQVAIEFRGLSIESTSKPKNSFKSSMSNTLVDSMATHLHRYRPFPQS